MTNFASQIAGLATLALAALPMVALSTAARAAPAAPAARIQVADLNLASIDGAVALRQRIATAAHQICGDEKNLGQQAACMAGVRDEVAQKLSQRQVAIASAT